MRWQKILTTWSEAEAIMVKGLLEGEGIVCRIESQAVPQFPVTVDGLAEIYISVPEEDAAIGREILRKIRESNEEMGGAP